MAEAPSEDLRDVIPGVLRDVLISDCDKGQTKACMWSRYARQVHGNVLYRISPFPLDGNAISPKSEWHEGNANLCFTSMHVIQSTSASCMGICISNVMSKFIESMPEYVHGGSNPANVCASA